MKYLTVRTPERRQSRRSGVFIVNLNKFSRCSCVSIIDFEQVMPAVITLTSCSCLISDVGYLNYVCVLKVRYICNLFPGRNTVDRFIKIFT